MAPRRDRQIVYSVSDAPVIEKLGLYAEQQKTRDGKVNCVGCQTNRLTYR